MESYHFLLNNIQNKYSNIPTWEIIFQYNNLHEKYTVIIPF